MTRSDRGKNKAAVCILALATLASVAAAEAADVEVFSVDPAFSAFNVAGRTVTIKGVGFTASTTVKFDATTAAVTFVNSRTLTATVPTVASARVSTITVTDPSNGTDNFYPYLYTGSTVYHVALTGSDSNNGTAPGTPKRTLGAALAAVSGTTPTEVRVGAGRFAEAQLAILNATVISCGWASGFGSRDTEANITDFDANRGGFFARTSGLASVSVVDGCTIRGGLRDGFGGGGLAITADSAVINNNVFYGNLSTTMGGALYTTASTSYGARPTFSNNVIIGNRAHGKNGGGIVIYPNYNSQQEVRFNITGNQIVGNRSINARGGGIALTTGSYSGYNVVKLVVADNLIGWNLAKTGAGADLTSLTFGDTFDVSFDNNLIVGNAAVGAGGGLSFGGLGGVIGRVQATTVANNSAAASQGGGLVLGSVLNLPSGFTASDLILWGNVGGDAFGQAVNRVIYSDSGTALTGTGNISSNPAFVTGPLGGFYLRQSDPNGPDSPAVNAGSAQAAVLALDSLTTRADLALDSGMADQGFHYAPLGSPSADAITISRIDPGAGDFNGKDWVLIRGTGFDPGAGVKFGGVNATNVVYLNAKRVLAQPAAHAQGLIAVRVTNPDATFAEIPGSYRYTDVDAPTWVSTVGVTSAATGQDCVRAVTLDWNDAVEAASPPIVYEVYREDCLATTSNTVPCANFGYIPNAVNFIGSTVETYFVDANHPASGQDPKYVYTVRARDSNSFAANKEWNFGRRVSLATKVTGETTPPGEVGDTLVWASGTNLLDWTAALGAVSYGVYRVTDPSLYQNPGSLTKLATLTKLNNDFNGDGVTDSQYTDNTNPTAGQIFFYKMSALDLCNNETVSELAP